MFHYGASQIHTTELTFIRTSPFTCLRPVCPTLSFCISVPNAYSEWGNARDAVTEEWLTLRVVYGGSDVRRVRFLQGKMV
jgi:hypothetical protein